MAQYYTDFSEYTTGQHPAGWTQRRDEATSWSVEADAGATGGKVLRFPGKAANTQSILTWDAIDSDSGRADVEFLIRYRYGGTSASLYAWARDASTSSGATGYRMGDSYTGTTIGIIGKYVSGSYSNIYTAGGGAINATNTWAYIRAQISGNSLRVRVWRDGNAEPNTWSGTGTDNSLSTGRVGIMIFNTAPVDIDWIGIGTGGDPAPDSPVGPGDVTVTPDAGALTLTGHSPQIITSDHVTVHVGTGALSLTGHAPTVVTSAGVVVEPGVGALALSGFAPSVAVSDHITVTPDPGHLALTGHAPQIGVGVSVSPGVGQLQLSGHAPTVRTTGHVTVTPGAGDLVITGHAPTVIGMQPTRLPGGDDAPISAADYQRWRRAQEKLEVLRKRNIEENVKDRKNLRDLIEQSTKSEEIVENVSNEENIEQMPEPTRTEPRQMDIDATPLLAEIGLATRRVAKRRYEDELIEILLLVA